MTLDELALGQSSVVANCAMNRERQLAGVNSYTRVLGFNPLETLTEQIGGGSPAQPGTAAWLDLCCGSGRALVHAAQQLNQAGLVGQAALMGVDLVDTFEPHPRPLPGLELVCASAADWQPPCASTSSPACTDCTTSATSSACSPAPPAG